MLQALRGLFHPPKARPVIPASVTVAHGGTLYPVAIKRVARARRFTLRVRAATQDAVLTMPPGQTLAAARRFADQHAAWIAERLGALPRPIALAVGSVIPFRGEALAILPSAGLRAAAFLDQAQRPDGSVGPVLRVSGSPSEQRRRVLAFLQNEARRDLEAAVARHAAAVGRRPGRISLRDTRSRWGSCSSRGGLNFSWRLILAPPFVLDYLAAHEVAHLVHLDHSAAYWAVAGRLAPDLDEAEAWLRRHGASLHRIDGGRAGAPAAALKAA